MLKSVSYVVAHFLLLLPSAAVAEVMDKIALPWEPRRLVPVAIVSAVCAAVALRSGRARMLVAVGLAVLWAAGITIEPLYDPQVGPAMESEMSPGALQAYRVLAPVGELLPLAVVAAVIVRRAWRTQRRHSR